MLVEVKINDVWLVHYPVPYKKTNETLRRLKYSSKLVISELLFDIVLLSKNKKIQLYKYISELKRHSIFLNYQTFFTSTRKNWLNASSKKIFL